MERTHNPIISFNMLIVLIFSIIFFSVEAKEISIFQTSKSGDRLSTKPNIPFQTTPLPDLTLLSVNDEITYQEIEGFGGAFTDSSAYVFSQLSPDLKEQVLTSYFSPPPNGHNYTLGRIPIGSSDFTFNGSYSFNEHEFDFEMNNFSISHDQKYLIPFILRAIKKKNNGVLKLFGCPWSAPAWMKRNRKMINSEMPGMIQQKEYFQAWATYLSLFLSEYEKSGVSIWGLEMQNEPRDSIIIPFECMGYKGGDEGQFVLNYLGPMLREKHPDVKILIYADQKDENMLKFLADFFGVADEVKEYVDGITYHWYGDFLKNYEILTDTWNKYNLPLISSEATVGGKIFPRWEDGQNYAIDIIGGLNNWAVGWTDWNMLLDWLGGPTHSLSCDSQIKAGYAFKSIEYRFTYWHMGHFSRYFPPGSYRIDSRWGGNSTELKFVAVKRPEYLESNRVALVVSNPSDASVSFQLEYKEMYAKISIPSKGTQTLLFG